MPAANPVRVAASMMVVTSLLLSDMVAFDIRKNKSLKQIYLSLSRYVIHAKDTVFYCIFTIKIVRNWWCIILFFVFFVFFVLCVFFVFCGIVVM